ncbi:DNA-binding protein [Actinophytocola sp.]|uniref:DNA-binding protein n=1 Tax=Actinophytocola sp. TaxID=1872138 RepID=UPI002ED9B5B1
MSASLRSALARAGLRVDSDEFLGLVADAASRLSPADPAPAEFFTDSQRAALSDVGLDLAPRRDGERDPRARAVALQAVLRDTALTVAGAAERINVDSSRIRHRLAAGKLTGWKDGGEWRLPVWQFTNDGVLPGLEPVLESVPDDQPPLMVAGFLTTPQEDLPLGGHPATPRDWLLAGGDPARVARLVATLGTPA